MNNFKDMKMRAEQMVGQNMKSIAPNILSTVRPNELVEIKCVNCGGEVFYPAHTLKFASQFQTRNGMPTMVQFPLGFACVNCDQINPFNKEIIGGPADKDGQKSKAQQKEENTPGGDLGISVSEEVKPKEHLN